MTAPRCPVCGGRMLRRHTSEQETRVLVIWWCAGIDKHLVLHNLTLTQTKKDKP